MNNISINLNDFKINEDKLIKLILKYIDKKVISKTSINIYDEQNIRKVVNNKRNAHKLQIKKKWGYVAMAYRYKNVITNDEDWINRQEDYSVFFNCSILVDTLKNSVGLQEYVLYQYYKISDLLEEDEEGYTEEDFILKALNLEFIRIMIHELYHVTNYYRDTEQYNTEYLVDGYAVMCVKDILEKNNNIIPIVITPKSIKEVVAEQLKKTSKDILSDRLIDMIRGGLELKPSDKIPVEPMLSIKTLDNSVLEFRKTYDIIDSFTIEKMENILLQHPNYKGYFDIDIENLTLVRYNKRICNIIMDIINDRKIPETIPSVIFDSRNFNRYRYIFIKIMGFANITKEFIRSLKEKVIGNGKCLEIMCGTGVFSKALQEEGVEVIATDNYCIDYGFETRHLDVEEIDCLDAIRKYGKDVDYVICSWIPYNSPIGYEALKLMNEVNPDCKMISINEPYGGCCADDNFFNHVEELMSFSNDNNNFFNWDTGEDTVYYRTWEGIHDYVSVIKYTETPQIDEEDDEDEEDKLTQSFEGAFVGDDDKKYNFGFNFDPIMKDCMYPELIKEDDKEEI